MWQCLENFAGTDSYANRKSKPVAVANCVAIAHTSADGEPHTEPKPDT